MTILTPEEQFLMGGEGVPSAFTKSDPVGTRRGGAITERPELRQQTDFDSGALLTWDDGSPRQHLVVTVQTDLRDSDNPDDDGRRRFYVKGNLQKVLREAVRKSGAKGLEVGGQLYITRIGRDEPKKRGLDGAWLHSAEYIPAAQAFVAPEQPAAAVTPTPAAAALTPAQIAALQAAGLTPPAQPAAPTYPGHFTPEQVAGFEAAGISPADAARMFPAPVA